MTLWASCTDQDSAKELDLSQDEILKLYYEGMDERGIKLPATKNNSAAIFIACYTHCVDVTDCEGCYEQLDCTWSCTGFQ